MNLIIRIVAAVLVGVIITGVLDYLHILTPSLNALIGVLAAILVFWQYDGAIPGRRI